MSPAKGPYHYGLVDVDKQIGAAELKTVAAALEKQVNEHFAPVWHVTATVAARTKAEPSTLRIELRKHVDGTAAGFHLEKEPGQDDYRPYAVIDLSGLQEEPWSQVASHELLEMLADPWGSERRPAPAPHDAPHAPTTVQYLVEVCDPCRGKGYLVDGVRVSDFVLQEYYDPSTLGSFKRYSHAGNIRKPLDVLKGGYVSFRYPGNKTWWWKIYYTHETKPKVEEVPKKLLQDASFREQIDIAARESLRPRQLAANR